MRISDWSSDVCSSDLSLHASRTTCPGRGSSDGYLGLIIAPIGAGGQHAHATIHVAGLVDPDRICLGPRHRWLCVNAAQHGKCGRLFSGEPSRSEEHTSELQSLMRISYAVFCLKKKKKNTKSQQTTLQ